MKVVQTLKTEGAESGADTPALRLFGLIEAIAAKDQLVSLQGLVEETGLPKPTVHRMLQLVGASDVSSLRVTRVHGEL